MRSTIPAPIQQELDAAIARGASEAEQAMIFCGYTPLPPLTPLMPSGRPWPEITRKRPYSKAEVQNAVERYRLWLEGSKT